ncbi:MAG: helix-turn-helix transcriptional regulator [Bacillota bacterium]|nr:helix-turn-helix transcriptional regulator [Bacillota bacterium]
MKCTKFGEYIRILRIKNGESMKNTAELFNVSVPFVSAVENGKKSIPETWFKTLVMHYQLDENESIELREAIDNSKTNVKIDLSKALGVKREMAMQFQRSFNDIDDDTALKIIKLLEKKGGK